MVKRSKRKHHVMSVSQAKTANKRLKRKAKKKPNQSAALKDAWDTKKTAKQNMMGSGLLFDMMDFASTSKTRSGEKIVKAKPDVVEKMHVEAVDMIRDPNHRLAEPNVLFCVQLIERYDDDYQAMSRDSSNHYQETPKQIRKKIEHFKRTPQYAAYLKAKQTAKS